MSKTKIGRVSVGVLSTVGAPFAGRIIEAMLELGVPVDAVIMDPKGLSERDQKIHEERTAGRLPPISLERFAGAFERYDVVNHNTQETSSLIRELKLDLLVNSETPRILKGPVLDAARIGVLNCHPGLLPEFRGRTCVEWAVYLDQPVGNTIHLMEEAIDAGPIVLREPTEIGPSDRYVDLRVKVFAHGVNLMARAVSDIYFRRRDPETFEAQAKGVFHDVIDPVKMAEVERKLAEGRYTFQR